MAETPTTTIKTVATKTTAVEATTTSHAPAWVTVATLSGKAEKIGELFELTGASARLSYKVTGNYAIAAIYVMPDGKTLEKDGGIPDVMLTDQGSDQTMLKKDAGTYYLQAKANVPWEVTIEEQR